MKGDVNPPDPAPRMVPETEKSGEACAVVGFRRTKAKERASSARVAFATDSASVPEACGLGSGT